MRIAVIVPCLNEEVTVAHVVEECRRHLPEARVYVLDNGSRDATAARARAAGAEVIHSPLRGKGHVLRHAFRVIDADYFVMIDGDGTYPVSEAARLIRIAHDLNYEMVMGARLKTSRPEAFRRLHLFGNHLFTTLVRSLFGYPVQDLLTGFRVFSRRFTEEVAVVSSGFEIETELTIRAIAQNLAFCEVEIPYVERPRGSHSKLRTFRDGWRILWTIARALKAFRPLYVFLPLAAISLGLAALTPPLLAQALSTFAALVAAMGVYFDSRLSLERLRIGVGSTKRLPAAPSSARDAA